MSYSTQLLIACIYPIISVLIMSIGSFYCGNTARCSHTSVLQRDGSILVMGGRIDVGGLPGVSNEVWKSRDGGRSWARLTGTAWGTLGGK